MLHRATTVLLVAILAAALWGFWLEPSSLTVREVDLPLAWPRAQPLRVAVLSDLHVGSPYYGISRLPEVVERTNATHPDLICILGDVLTLGVIGGHYVPPAPIASQLRHLRARYGVYAVLGNHDRLADGLGLEGALEGAGIRVLEDTAVLVRTADGPLWLAGVSDLWTGPHDVARALEPVQDSTTPLIVMTHNPDLFPELPPRVLLTLAGHTHGGQVRLPLIGALIVPSRYGQRYVAGHVIERGHDLFVTTGLGTSDLPVRFGVPPRIEVITVRQAGARARAGRPPRRQPAPE